MVWALFLMIYKDIADPFDSHMIATYKTIEECNDAAHNLKKAWFEAGKDDKYRYLIQRTQYVCAVIPKQ